MLVLIWNVFHGRSRPPAGRELFDEFAASLEAWNWDAALLQEVPPWWCGPLASRCGAEESATLTSRNWLPAMRRAVATRWPDLIKSNGGGANLILVRGRRILEHRRARLCWLPERRWVHAVAISDGTWVGNLHTEPRAEQGAHAARMMRAWAGEQPVVLGGDFNVPADQLAEALAEIGFTYAGGSGGDLVFADGLIGGNVETVDRGPLSDHAPLVLRLSRSRADARQAVAEPSVPHARPPSPRGARP